MTIKDILSSPEKKVNFDAVDNSCKNLCDKLHALTGKETHEETFYGCLKKQWERITSGKEFHCYEELNGELHPQHVDSGREVPYPCVFIFNCECLRKSDNKEIYLRIKIDKIEQEEDLEVSELYFCDKDGHSFPFEGSEAEFLSQFITAVDKCGFFYEPQDLIRFHTCVKCGFLTVLGGAPGVGKSSLVKLYANAILGRENGKCKDGLLTVDVNSAWAEPADILGYWDLDNKFRPAPSAGVVPFLWKAQKHEHLNLICLEEMNLARVEHYFSDFMQQSERMVSEREIKGVPRDEKSGDKQNNAYLPIDESVRIVGTNNFDETTQRFSARFFDRCNFIELQDSRTDEDFLTSKPNINQGEFYYPVSIGTYKSWIKSYSKGKKYNEGGGVWLGDENGKEILGIGSIKKYKEIRGALSGLNLKPSPRVESLLVEYVVNRPFVDQFEIDCEDRQVRVLDEFVAQRILPRYTPSYLKDDSKEREALKSLFRGGNESKDIKMPLSLKIIEDKEHELEGLPR